MSNNSTMDGTTAAHAAYAFIDVAAIFPSPSSPMAELVDEQLLPERRTFLDNKVTEMESKRVQRCRCALAGWRFNHPFTASQGCC